MHFFQNIAEKYNESTCMYISTRVHVCVGVSSAEKQGFPQCRGCLLSRSGVVRSVLPLLP